MKSENLISPRFNIPSPLMGEGREGVGQPSRSSMIPFLTFPRKGGRDSEQRVGVDATPPRIDLRAVLG
jgi:hypothetical protein